MSEMTFEEWDEAAFEKASQPSTTVSPNDLIGSSPNIEEELHEEFGEEDKEDKEEQKPEVKKKTKEPIKDTEVADEIPEEAIVTEEEETEYNNVTANLLKAKAEGLIERGIWQDFDMPEDFEWTEEAYGDIAIAQANWKAEETLSDMIEKTGEYGKIIFDHIQKGGNPDEIINLFKESNKIKSYNTESPEGQKTVIREYYKNVMNWSDEKITRFINSAVDRDELESEAVDTKDLLQKEVDKQVEQTRKEQEVYLEQQKKLEREFASNMNNALSTRQDIAEKEKKEIINDLLTYDKDLNGRRVNQFTLDFMKLQSDPSRYIDLVLFVRNPEKYIEKISEKASKKTKKQTWDLVKGSGSLSRSGASHNKTKSNDKSDLVINWKEDFRN